MNLLAKGAEAEVYLAKYWGCKAVYKVRKPKAYRHPKLDLRLRYERTRNEFNNMLRAYKEGMNVPTPYDVDYNEYSIVMEYIEGTPLSEKVEAWAIEEAGRQLAILHSADIAHWDYTTANLIIKGRKLFIIDFGLSRKTKSDIEKAIDAHLMIRSFLSAHPGREDLVDRFWKGYSEFGEAEKMRELTKQIELLGRYVKERRKTVW
ncbi:KEOPS complex kinase/ATPase Bud32 [Ignicoccus hospitalis]|uniref:non-specific serine/threonine protein kinase n=1 Tax=Ignicoccus hospitalis (strain KIN4/I / DSM 18386 / JCM 14125) TaxID=453591 RepID=A8A8W0_IGNH4|nr:KEOPS complex kinase/ATPase Bud32 [Ignicoccus hospitalis]ABU81362.1 Mn2+-dependent serine/threonine protein kinase [Ignicoccus hospitalis KIN4/I]HIH90334.1 Kae1-associated serine/threonine protein kinase [Desulfurococcaceae archaeon]